jgi:branched-chain amino acid transport system ATP-binding protein
MTALLEVDGLSSGYGPVGVLEGVSLAVGASSIVAVVGANGAGKTTLLRTISGLLKPTSGRIRFRGAEIGGAAPVKIVQAGILHVAEGRWLFRAQSVADNLELGLYGARLSKAVETQRYERAFELFPVLRERLKTNAGALSGGQQQMLAIAQALMRDPQVLMLDEPSLGLAPSIVDQVFDAIVRLRESGVAILLVEQMVELALEMSDFGYVLQNGRVIGSGPPSALTEGDMIRRAYLGVEAAFSGGHAIE